MEIKRVCNKCGEVNTLSSETLLRKDVYDEYGKHYKIIYYKCERCKEIVVLQIDDNETIKVFREFKKLLIKVARKNAKGETISPKDIRKKDKFMKELRSKRKILEELTSGKKMYADDKKIFIQQLTFQKEDDIIESDM